ncbi:MAG: PAS-domain containing protein [Novosphingobium sp.]|nr:PAS-domain containing protein [Novosphingobium sp.]
MRLMKEVLERLPQGVVMFDADGNVAFANRRYSEIYTCIPQVACRLR